MCRYKFNIVFIAFLMSLLGSCITLHAKDDNEQQESTVGKINIPDDAVYETYDDYLRKNLVAGYTEDAMAAEKEGDIFLAMQLFQMAYDMLKLPETAINLAYCFVELSNSGLKESKSYLDSAKIYFDACYMMDSTNVQAMKGLVLYYTHTGDKFKELEMLQRIAEIEPSEFVYTLMADLYYNNHDYDNLAIALKCCIDLSGKGIYYLKLSAVYDEQGKSDSALTARANYLKSGDIDDSGMEWWFNSVLQHKEMTMLINAIDTIAKICKPQTLNKFFINMLWYNVKDDSVDPENFKKMLQIMNKSVLDKQIGNVITSNLYLQLGMQDSAIGAIRSADNYNSFLQSRAIEAFLNYGCDEEALSLIKENPDSVYCSGPEMLENLMQLFEKHADIQTSIKIMENYIATSDTVYCFYYAVAAGLAADLNEGNKAISYIEKAYKCSPEDLEYANSYSYFLALAGKDLPLALQLIEPCVKNFPLNSFYLDTYAWVKYKLGDFEMAAKNINKALSIDKNSSDIWYHRGCILYKMGQIQEALQSWEKAEELVGKEK